MQRSPPPTKDVDHNTSGFPQPFTSFRRTAEDSLEWLTIMACASSRFSPAVCEPGHRPKALGKSSGSLGKSWEVLRSTKSRRMVSHCLCIPSYMGAGESATINSPLIRKQCIALLLSISCHKLSPSRQRSELQIILLRSILRKPFLSKRHLI